VKITGTDQTQTVFLTQRELHHHDIRLKFQDLTPRRRAISNAILHDEVGVICKRVIESIDHDRVRVGKHDLNGCRAARLRGRLSLHESRQLGFREQGGRRGEREGHRSISWSKNRMVLHRARGDCAGDHVGADGAVCAHAQRRVCG
jgi:hypothetical protein